MAQPTMRKVSLRNIAAHKLRLALTVLAVVLGTAFISGAFMFTNSLSNTFDSAVSNAYSGVDAVVSDSPTLTERDQLLEDPKVNNVNVTTSTTIVAATGDEANPEPLQTGGGTATLSIWYDEAEVVGEQHELTEGAAPQGDTEIAISADAAEKFGIGVGDELLVVDQEARHEMTVSGLWDSELEQGTNLVAYMEEGPYLDRYISGDSVNQLLVDAADGTSSEDLVEHLEAELPDRTVETGEKLAEDMSSEIQSALSFVNYFLVAFGLVALLVGTFLIANTFSMIVAQRTKEFALLRALGASRGQITRSVTLEAVIIGLIGSAIGVVAGIGLVAAIKAVMDAQGMGLPDSGLGLSTPAVVVPIVLGTIVTVLSAWAPARRAGEVEPVEAMRSSESATNQPLVVRTVLGSILLIGGIASAAAGVAMSDSETTTRAILVGVGAFAVIVGFFLAGPALSLPVVPTFGRVIGFPFGAVGKLASTNTRRNPRRTATTAFALALGIALITAIGMLGETMKSSIADTVESNVSADYILSPPAQGTFPIPAEVPDAAADTDGVGEVISYVHAPVAIDGTFGYDYGPGVGATDAIDGDPAQMAKLEIVEGTSAIPENGFIAPEEFAADHGWQVGEAYEVSAPGASPRTTEAELVGLFKTNDIFSGPLLASAAAEEVLPDSAMNILMMGINGDGSVEDEQLRANLEDTVAPFIVVQVMDSEEMSGMADEMIDQMLNILYALLALAVIIAILGIVNTLTLSVIERRQEIGMLRAVGSLRRQIRTMITLEAVQISLFGALAGILIGLGLGWSFIRVLEDQGLGDPVVPWQLLGAVLAGALLVGLIAALWPAQRAAKTPPLDAIAD